MLSPSWPPRSIEGGGGWLASGTPRHTRAVDVVAELAAPCGPEELFIWVEDLGRYPHWLEIVTRADPLAVVGDGAPAWMVDLRGRLGPLARSKRLRMVRTCHDVPRVARFERREVDGRSHSPWVLEADVTASPGGSLLTMRLHYGGSLWGPVLQRLLGDEIARSRVRLLDRVAQR